MRLILSGMLLSWLLGATPALAETIVLHLGATEETLDSDLPHVTVDLGAKANGRAQAFVQPVGLARSNAGEPTNGAASARLESTALGEARDTARGARQLELFGTITTDSGRYSVVLSAELPPPERKSEVFPVVVVGTKIGGSGDPKQGGFEYHLTARLE